MCKSFRLTTFLGDLFAFFSTDSNSASKFALYDTHYQIFAKKDLPTPRRLSGRTFGDSPATDKNSACIRGTPEGSAAFLFPEIFFENISNSDLVIDENSRLLFTSVLFLKKKATKNF